MPYWHSERAKGNAMASSGTSRTVNGLLLLMAVVILVLVVLARWPSDPRWDARAEPDPDRVLTAVEAHQAVLDAEWTDPGASTGGPSPMPAETTIRDGRTISSDSGLR